MGRHSLRSLRAVAGLLGRKIDGVPFLLLALLSYINRLLKLIGKTGHRKYALNLGKQIFMGISDKIHFDWILEASNDICEKIQKSLLDRGDNILVIGIGEHAPNPLLGYLLENISFDYILHFPKK